MEEDFIARAEELNRQMIAAGIAQAQRQETKPANFFGMCECGEQIPEGRIALGYYRCTTCQSTIEKRRRLFNV